MNEQQINRIFDILVGIAGAREDDRASFVYDMLSPSLPNEWRFCGKLGFGGKYRPFKNTVDCYPEDQTPERLVIIEETNKTLAATPE